MSQEQIIEKVKSRLSTASGHFEDELKGLRTGRASAGMLDGVMVEAYGTSMPLNQVANVTAPEAQLIQITPFDPGNIQAICTAIRDNQTLGFNPMDDGRVVRVNIPPLTTERRQQIVKLLGEKMEECMVSMRGARHDALKEAEAAKKDKAMGEDDYNRLEKQVDDLMARSKNAAELAASTKEKEILTL